MKIKTIFSLIGITATMAIGALVGLNVHQNSEVKEAKAANTGAVGDVIYFTPTSNFAEAGATFKLNFYKNGSFQNEIWMEKITPSSGSFAVQPTFSAKATKAFDQVQILRFNPDKSQQWNYSSNISLSGTNRWLRMLSSYSASNSFGLSSGNVWWQDVDLTLKREDQSASTATTRIFINNSGSHFNPVGIRAWGGSASTSIGGANIDATIYHPTWIVDERNSSSDKAYYGYCDIPTNVTGFKIVKLSAENSYDALVNYYSDDPEFKITDATSRGVFYCPSDGNTVTIGGAKDDRAGAVLMTAVCQAYNTCSDSSINGYGAYSTLNNYYFSHANTAAKAATVTSLNGDRICTVQEQFDAMAERSSRSSSSRFMLNSLASNNATSTIVVVTSLISVCALGAFFFLKKKKENN